MFESVLDRILEERRIAGRRIRYDPACLLGVRVVGPHLNWISTYQRTRGWFRCWYPVAW